MNPRLVHLASGHAGDLQHEVQSLPYWAQLLVALGCALVGYALMKWSKSEESWFLEIIGFALSIAGAILALTVLF